MKKKLRLEELKLQSFVTNNIENLKSNGGRNADPNIATFFMGGCPDFPVWTEIGCETQAACVTDVNCG